MKGEKNESKKNVLFIVRKLEKKGKWEERKHLNGKRGDRKGEEVQL